MAKAPVHPEIDLVSFSCPHCGALAHQTWYDIYADRIEEGPPLRAHAAFLEVVKKDPNVSADIRENIARDVERRLRGEVFLVGTQKTLYGRPSLENVSVSVCYSCEKLALWVHDHVVYPAVADAGIEPNDDLSEDIKRDFKEAGAILNASARGAAALLRLCVQKLCVQLGEPGKVLNDDIASLVRKGLDQHVQQALDIVRVVGNNSVHPGVLDLRDDRNTALQLFSLINEIADELITRPARVQKIYNKVVPESDRAKIAKRDK